MSCTILTVVGARPQFVKAAALCRVLAQPRYAAACRQVLVHTGQHYDARMSDIFFQELGLPEPDFHLGIGSGPHGQQTGRMLEAIEGVIGKVRPDWCLVYGDTNSTLAGALAAAKLHVPVAHVEAGLRSGNRRMPEELNRVLTDHVSDLLLCPHQEACQSLAAEGLAARCRVVGDIMHDCFLHYRSQAPALPAVLAQTGCPRPVAPGSYYLATVHRAENTDDPVRLAGILTALNTLASRGETVILALHPRTRQRLAETGLAPASELIVSDPVGYLAMLTLETQARAILTDSGGVQKEACFAGVPCFTLRDETEWRELVAAGVNRVVGTHPEEILQAVAEWRTRPPVPVAAASIYGGGDTSERILAALLEGTAARS